MTSINRRTRARRIAKRPLQLESLEARHLLAAFTPTPDADDGAAGSLRAAVVASQSNQEDDTVELGAGIYTLRLGDLLVNESGTNLRVVGAGAEQTVVKID